MKGGVGYGLHVYLVGEKRWQRMAFQDSLPANIVTALAYEGTNAWIGGPGYIAVEDLDQDKIRKICHLDSTVEKLCVKDGNAWVQTEGALYRVPLAILK